MEEKNALSVKILGIFLNIPISEYNDHLWSSVPQGLKKPRWEEVHTLQDCRLSESKRKRCPRKSSFSPQRIKNQMEKLKN